MTSTLELSLVASMTSISGPSLHESTSPSAASKTMSFIMISPSTPYFIRGSQPSPFSDDRNVTTRLETRPGKVGKLVRQISPSGERGLAERERNTCITAHKNHDVPPQWQCAYSIDVYGYMVEQLEPHEGRPNDIFIYTISKEPKRDDDKYNRPGSKSQVPNPREILVNRRNVTVQCCR